MIMKSNLGKMLGRMAPQQGAGMTVQPQRPQLGGGLMAGLNQPNPPGGMMSSDMIGTLGRMLGGRRPMRPTNTGNGELVMPAIPQPYQKGPDGGMPPMADKGFDPVAWMNQPYTPVSPQPRALTPEEAMAITSMPATRPAQPMPDIVVAQRPPEMPQGVGQIYSAGSPVPKFDPNRALQDYNMTLKRLYEGGAKMDLNAAREQQGILRNLQTNLSATPEQHDAAYRTALADLRSRYPDAFAG